MSYYHQSTWKELVSITQLGPIIRAGQLFDLDSLVGVQSDLLRFVITADGKLLTPRDAFEGWKDDYQDPAIAEVNPIAVDFLETSDIDLRALYDCWGYTTMPIARGKTHDAIENQGLIEYEIYYNGADEAFAPHAQDIAGLFAQYRETLPPDSDGRPVTHITLLTVWEAWSSVSSGLDGTEHDSGYELMGTIGGIDLKSLEFLPYVVKEEPEESNDETIASPDAPDAL